MAPVPNELLIKLRDTFRDNFKLNELADLCLELGVEYESLSGNTINEKSRELATYLGRRSLIPKLAEVGPKSRPDIDWQAVLAPYGFGPPVDPDPVAPAPTRVNEEDLGRLRPILADYSEFDTPGSRRDMLAMAGVLQYLDVDLNGSARRVAGAVLLRLNERGQVADGVLALGRLLQYLLDDDTLPQSARDTITAISARYSLL